MNKGAKRSLRIDPHIIGILAIFVVFFAAMCATQGQRFLRVSIFKSMMYQFPEYGLLSFGVMLALISGGNDLSTVGVANLTGILSAMLLGACGYFRRAGGAAYCGNSVVCIAHRERLRMFYRAADL